MTDEKVTVERDGYVLSIGIDRVEKKNAWDADVISGVAQALQYLGDDDELRVGVIFGHGPDFTAGLDLMSVAPALAEGKSTSSCRPTSPIRGTSSVSRARNLWSSRCTVAVSPLASS